MSTSPILEVCLESAAGVAAAREGGADRVELCTSLLEGGLTPSAGLIAASREVDEIGLMVMIRPRGGDFLYSEAEFDVMLRDIETARSLGADGVVFGLLRPDGTIDEARTSALVEAARPLSVTFHRAFDMSRDLSESLAALKRCDVDRVLTSGGFRAAPEGLDVLRSLVEQAGDDLVVMPGCGIREHNVAEVLAKTGAREVHFSSGRVVESAMVFRNQRCAMGSVTVPSEYERTETDAARVREYVRAAKQSL